MQAFTLTQYSTSRQDHRTQISQNFNPPSSGMLSFLKVLLPTLVRFVLLNWTVDINLWTRLGWLCGNILESYCVIFWFRSMQESPSNIYQKTNYLTLFCCYNCAPTAIVDGRNRMISFLTLFSCHNNYKKSI